MSNILKPESYSEGFCAYHHPVSLCSLALPLDQLRRLPPGWSVVRESRFITQKVVP